MKSWLMKAVLAGAAIASFGPGAPVLAQIEQEQAVVLTLNQTTTCRRLFSEEAGIRELVVRSRRSGIRSDGTLKVNMVVVNRREFDWESVSPTAARAATRVKAVIVEDPTGSKFNPDDDDDDDDDGVAAKAYLYPKGALFDAGLARHSRDDDGRTRFCYGGTFSTLAKFGECPLTGDPMTPGTPLGAACAASGALFFMYFDLFTSDAGPREGEGPALCRCTNTSFTCDPSLFRERGACFGTDENGDPLGEGIVESAVGAEANVIVREDFNPRCRTKCFDLDGVRICERYCRN